MLSRSLCLLFIAITLACNAQTDSVKASMPVSKVDTNVRVVSNSSVSGTIQKVQQYQQLSHGTFSGFRIQIQFGSDRNGANTTKTDFSTKYRVILPTLPISNPILRYV